MADTAAKSVELKNALMAAELELKSKQLESIDQNMINKSILASAAESQAATAKKGHVLKLIISVFKAIWGFITFTFNLFKIVLRDLSPYIALAIVILVFIWAFSNSGSRGGSSRRSANNRNLQHPNAPKQPYRWLKWFTPGHRIRGMFNYFRSNPTSIARPIERFGRCDNVEWQHNGVNGPGLCTSTVMPKPIEWTLKEDTMPDLKKLPAEIKKRLTADSQKMKVFIPWAAQGPFYVPQCSKAYFRDTSQGSAAYLFKDNGLTCERVTRESKTYGVEYRPRGEVDKRNYASEANPKCNAE
jgi:hypothetical protein